MSFCLLRVDSIIVVFLPGSPTGRTQTVADMSAANGGPLRVPVRCFGCISCHCTGCWLTSRISLCQLGSWDVVIFDGLRGPDDHFVICRRGRDGSKCWCRLRLCCRRLRRGGRCRQCGVTASAVALDWEPNLRGSGCADA